VVVEATAKVTTLEVVDAVGLNEAVTPEGRVDVAKLTLPVNPPASPTVTVSVPLAPSATVSADAEDESVKLGFCTTVPPQAVPLIAKFVGTALVPLQVPLKPIPVRLPPAAMLPL